MTFNGEFLTGYAVIVAETTRKALIIARNEIKGMGAAIQSKTTDLGISNLVEIDTENKGALVIWDGDY